MEKKSFPLIEFPLMKSKLAAQRTNFPRIMFLSLRAMRAILTRKSDDSQQPPLLATALPPPELRKYILEAA
ncbi:hypothetical protein [Chromobacterium vaccinii]|uniref:hypothetical protein n=1 Tax=Chromobacterium vaccinii TaxID=1108595 RepID=UPI0018F8A12B|nr:hypothetical protein [Chromobacterium vaccinii]